MELDVTAPEEILREKAKEAWSIYGHVDVLVNNAAYIDAGIFEEIEYAPTCDPFQIHLLTLSPAKHFWSMLSAITHLVP